MPLSAIIYVASVFAITLGGLHMNQHGVYPYLGYAPTDTLQVSPDTTWILWETDNSHIEEILHINPDTKRIIVRNKAK